MAHANWSFLFVERLPEILWTVESKADLFAFGGSLQTGGSELRLQMRMRDPVYSKGTSIGMSDMDGGPTA